MKNYIIRLLCSGVIRTTKYTTADLIRAFYPLKHLIKPISGTNLIVANSNPFWDAANNVNRCQLIHKLKRARLHDMHTDYFIIINRFENGDAWGIDKTEEAKQ